MLLTFRRCTFCCIHHCCTKHPGYLLFVWLYRLLLIHCIYVSVTKPTCPAFSAWLNTGAIRSSYVQHYMVNLMLVQCVIASHAEVWTCQFQWKFYQELTETMVQFPERMTVSTLCPIAKRSCWLNLSPGCLRFVNWTISSCLTSQASKFY